MSMAADREYTLLLTSKNEGLEYRDATGVYRFNVALKGKTWIVEMPPSHSDSFTDYELTESERNRILPRVSKYLSRIRWFGLFPRSYDVVFDE
jgi:hypothetical protein